MGWGVMNLLRTYIGGSTFLPDGFSFAALRVSTLVACVISTPVASSVTRSDLQHPETSPGVGHEDNSHR